MTWSGSEVGVLARAVSHAPSVHDTQPWTLEALADSAELYERSDVTLAHHDPSGRDRMISCGTALTNLELAVRALGWDAETVVFPDAAHPDLVARVRAGGRKETTATEVERYAAIFRRHSHRAPFSLHPVSRKTLRALADVPAGSGVQARVIDPRTECATLAELFDYAALVLRDDRAYQRELSSWSVGPRDTTLPWGGLVRADTHVPDTVTLTERLMQEGILMLLTPDDGRGDHLRAGTVMQQIWLAAISRGLVASVLTGPLHLHEVRAGLIERLELAGYPQLFLRLGHPVATSGPEVLGERAHRLLTGTPSLS
jgi:nitroreductase